MDDIGGRILKKVIINFCCQVELIKFDISFNSTIKQRASFVFYRNDAKNSDSDGNSDGDNNGDNDSDNDSDNDRDSDNDSNNDNKGNNIKKICIQDKLGMLVNSDYIMALGLRPEGYTISKYVILWVTT